MRNGAHEFIARVCHTGTSFIYMYILVLHAYMTLTVAFLIYYIRPRVILVPRPIGARCDIEQVWFCTAIPYIGGLGGKKHNATVASVTVARGALHIPCPTLTNSLYQR